MTRMPDRLTARPEERDSADHDDRRGTADLLVREVSRSLELAGSLFFRGDFTEPWAVRSRDAPSFTQSVRPGADRVVLFHAVLEGTLGVVLPDAPPERLGPGDVAILPYADQHVMHGASPIEPVPLDTLVPPLPWPGPPRLEHGGGGPRTTIACGFLHADDLSLHPILSAMPRLIVVRSGGGAFTNWLITNLRYALDDAIGSGWSESVLARRLPELLLLECLAHHARARPSAEWRWLVAAGAPVVGRAIALLHRGPAERWTLERLARACGTSRSVLGEHFQRLLGQPPMQYLTAWRLQLAMRALRSRPAESVAAIAERVGYGSESAFSRAFKRQTGRSPRDYRLRRSPEASPADPAATDQGASSP